MPYITSTPKPPTTRWSSPPPSTRWPSARVGSSGIPTTWSASVVWSVSTAGRIP